MKLNKNMSVEELNRQFIAGQAQYYLETLGIRVTDEDALTVYDSCEDKIIDATDSDGVNWKGIKNYLITAVVCLFGPANNPFDATAQAEDQIEDYANEHGLSYEEAEAALDEQAEQMALESMDAR